MKLRFKSLQGSTFTVDAEPSDTIATVKGKIESEQGHQASSQKLIFSGKILTDKDTVESCGVSEKDFLVLMVSKPKAAKPSAATGSTAAASEPAKEATAEAPPAAAQAPATAAAPDATLATPASTTPSAASAAQPSSSAPGTSQFLTGSALEEAVNNIVEMGFEKSEVQKAMRASFNNPERAVEYLMTGIPEHLSQPPQAPAAPSGQQASGEAAPAAAAAAPTSASVPSSGNPAPATTPAPAPASNPRAGNLFEAAAAAAQGGAGAGGRGAGRGGGAGDSMAALRDLGEDDGEGNTALDFGNPAMLAQLRQLVQQNPAALTPLVQALAQSNPQMANAMAEDPEAVLSFLANHAGGEEGEEGVGLPSMDELSPEDRTSVEQIIAMGIDESKAIEVYLMCGRNVEMAVQYYFENPQDFDD